VNDARVGLRIPTTEGRQLLVRPAQGGDGVQLAIIGKRGSMVEAVCIGLDQLSSTVLTIDTVSEWAWEKRARALSFASRKEPNVRLKRGICPQCNGNIALRSNGKLREHSDQKHELYGVGRGVRVPKCPGSGKFPEGT